MMIRHKMVTTKAQQLALYNLWQRHGKGMSYLSWRRDKCFKHYIMGCFMVRTKTMVIGVESDGHCHT